MKYILIILTLALISCEGKKDKLEIVSFVNTSNYSNFSCETIKEMSHANINQEKIDLQLDVVLQGCIHKANKEKKDDVAVTIAVKDPSQGKYFYGTINRKDLSKVQDKCHLIGGVAAGLISWGDEDVFLLLYRPGGRACNSIANALKSNNPLIVINPVAIIAGEEFKRQGKKVLEKLKVYDNYKQATKDLDKLARDFHSSFNDDLISVTSWIKEDEERAAKYLLFPGSQVAIEIVEKHHKKIEKELDRVGNDAENIIKKPIKKINERVKRIFGW